MYTVGPEIGKGSFATVYKCYHTKTHASVAVKLVVRSKLKSKKLVENLEIEVSILKTMKHPHIVGLLDYHQTSSHFHLVMDYCSMGDLLYFIRKRDQLVKTHPVISSLLERYPSPPGLHGLHETLVVHFLKQLCSALEFLRSKSLVHRDIKPQNLLLCPPMHSKADFEAARYVGLWELPVLKIADFGFARFLPSTSMAETLCGSPLYMAPEILRYEKYNAKADLWSVGAVLYEMTVGKPPFKAANHIELLKNIEKAHDRIKFPSSAQVPESLKRLIRSLLKYDPSERVSFNEFFADPVVTNELESINQPLETSNMDENLFISEYISPIRKPAPMTPLRSSQDEVIKDIITKNSPAPERITQLIHHPVNKKSEVVLEKDYVVVEKRAVEVNAIADELAHAGLGQVAIHPRHNLSSSSSSNDTFARDPLMYRRLMRSNSAESQRRPSFADRRISISISPTNALTKAIGLASNRLFGTPELHEMPESPIAIASSSTFANNLLKVNLPSNTAIVAKQSPDEEVLTKLEALATKAHAVNLFADVKFSQLIPSPPSLNGDDDLLPHNDMLPPKMIKAISEEGVVLYVKTLSLLAKAMQIASEWWYTQYDEDHRQLATLSLRINELVQWVRDRFNECLEKAEFIRLRLQEANAAIKKETGDSPSASFLDDSEKNGVVAEKLIFDRALEISRNAAVNELVKEDLKGCELAYSTAIWMLEALLDDHTLEEEKLDDEDRAMVEKFVVSIGNRLSVLKKKFELIES